VKDAVKKVRTRWQRLARGTQITLLVLVIVLIVVRLALPTIVKHYVNRQLNHITDYRGHVNDINIQLFRGAYKIKGLKMEKTSGAVPVPFLSIPEMDLSVQWGELFHGSAVGEVVMTRPQVNFVNGPTEAEQQTGGESKGWKQTLENLFPFKLNRFQVNEGDIRFRDFHRNPKVDIYITNLFATATNLTNSREVKQGLPAGLIARGKTIGGGLLVLDLQMNPMMEMPTFKVTAAISNMDLVALNDFMRAYGKFDVESGEFQVYTEIAAADGKYEGYVKPFFKNLDVFNWEKERGKNILEKFWEAIVAGVAAVMKNQPKNQLATKVPISGDFEKGSNIDTLTAVGGILKNAFVRALLPQVDRSVNVKDLEQKPKEKSKEPTVSKEPAKESSKEPAKESPKSAPP
jgi:hypothetical protein